MKQESKLVDSLSGRDLFKSRTILGASYLASEDNNLLEWLDKNSLFNSKQKSFFDCDYNGYDSCTYVIDGTNGVLCAIQLEKRDIKGSSPRYQWQAYVKHQPKDRDLPPELIQAFRDLGLQRME